MSADIWRDFNLNELHVLCSILKQFWLVKCIEAVLKMIQKLNLFKTHPCPQLHDFESLRRQARCTVWRDTLGWCPVERGWQRCEDSSAAWPLRMWRALGGTKEAIASSVYKWMWRLAREWISHTLLWNRSPNTPWGDEVNENVGKGEGHKMKVSIEFYTKQAQALIE